jgi:ABC-type transport system involved in cytochrome bd biosynthesis fused ATPase/permease subunit
MIPAIIFSLLFIILAIVFYLGKGDKLIAGYNTASEEERKKVNIQRLRILMSCISVITAAFCVSMPIVGNNIQAQLGAAAVFMAVIIFVVILANTWAKKK